MKVNKAPNPVSPGLATVVSLHAETAWRRFAILFVLLSGPCFLALIFTVLPPVLPGISAHFGGGAAGQLAAQLVMTLPSIGLMIGGPISGWLIDRFDARRVLFISLAAYAVLGVAGVVLSGQWSLLGTRLLLGFAASSLVTATNTLIGERYDEVTRARLIGYGTFFGAGTGLVSILVSGMIAETYSWHAPFVLYGAAFGVLLLALLVVPSKDAGARGQAIEQTNARGALISMAPLYALITLIFVAVFMTNAQVSFLLLADGVTSPAAQSQIIGMSALTNGLGGGCYGWVRVRLGLRWTFVLILGLLAIGITAIGLSHGDVLASIGCAVTGFGGGLAVPHFLNMVLDRAPHAVRSRALGLAYSAVFFGDFLNPFLMGPVTALAGIHGAFLIVGGVLAAGTLFQALFGRRASEQ